MKQEEEQTAHKRPKSAAALRWACRHWRLTLALAVVVLAAFVAWRVKAFIDADASLLTVEHTEAIVQTPEEIKAIRDIKQWEFLAVEAEELVEHHEAHTFGDKHLVKVYKGKLRIGLDMEHAGQDWFKPYSTEYPPADCRDVEINLPNVQLLDENFIDEARTITFYEEGKFDAKVKQQMYDDAAEKMKARTLTKANIEAARQAAKDQFVKIFRSLGYEKVTITFKKAETTAADNL